MTGGKDLLIIQQDIFEHYEVLDVIVEDTRKKV
jgi:hypothetical protein